MISDEEFCNMSKRKLREYLIAHPDEAFEIHNRYDLRSKGFTMLDVERLMGECPDYAESIEDILIDIDYKDFAEEYWEQFDDGYDPDAYFEDD